MIYIESYITDISLGFFRDNLNLLLNLEEINALVKEKSGINNFFTSQKEATELLGKIKVQNSIVSEPNRREYGDFQTNNNLALQITEYVFSKCKKVEFILEPTCGKGNFILASIKQYSSIKKIVGVEIYQPYIRETKFKILEFYLINKSVSKPDIDIIHSNAFEFSYEDLAKTTKHLKTLIIGNPPWVTNSELSSIDSDNLPKKSNFKNHKGFEAITGKGNFDIGEYIILMMLKSFENHNGVFAFLIKNSVVKNVIQEQRKNCYKINQIEKLNIDSKKEFNVSVNACLLLAHLNRNPDFTCRELDFYNKNHITTFGWHMGKFVYSIEDYEKSNIVDGKSTFVWRSGVKHDCSKIMELEQVKDYFKNGLGENIYLENELVFGLLKSSDLKALKINKFRKSTIITQKKIGQETEYIRNEFPLTYKYLNYHKNFFAKRKSSIYRDKPEFSIFGIGDYSFSKYKVAVSGLYKSTHFTLITPNDSKPIMLDDTCYFIGFDQLKMAEIAHYLVNTKLVQNFLKSIIFSDSKRAINKDILMRIDFDKVFENSNFKDAKEQIINLKIEDWKEFEKILRNRTNEQMTLF